MLKEQIKILVQNTAESQPGVRSRFFERLEEGLLTRDENNKSHFCVYFLPFNSDKNEVFLVHHKKANSWIAPGGHIDEGEDLLTTLNREIEEELGVANQFNVIPQPFFISITPIDNTIQTCKEHFDIWFLFLTKGSDFKVDPEEFYSVRWVALDQISNLVVDGANIKALENFKHLINA